MKNKKEHTFRRKVSLKTKASALFWILLFVAIVIASVVSLIVTTVTTASVVLSFVPNVIFSYLVGIVAGIVCEVLIFYFSLFVIGMILTMVGKWKCAYCLTRYRILYGNHWLDFCYIECANAYRQPRVGVIAKRAASVCNYYSKCEIFGMGDYTMTARECKRKRNRRNISRFDYDIIESDESKKKQERRKRYEEYFVQKLKEKAIS